MADNTEMKENIPEQEGKSIAMEIFQELKSTIRKLWIAIFILIALLAGTNIYHIYQWSQFESAEF